MTREELIQTPEYWRTLYENECERLDIKPTLKFIKPINEEELDKTVENIVDTFLISDHTHGNISYGQLKNLVKAGYRKAMEDLSNSNK